MTAPLQVVALGGGHGLSALLTTLRTLPVEPTAIVAVSDDGGSSGRLRRERGVIPPGDLRRCLLALSTLGSDWEELLDYRFSEIAGSSLSGHSVGNLLLTALLEQYADHPAEALRRAAILLKTVGAVLPVTEVQVELEGILVDGRRIRGEMALSQVGGLLRSVRLVPESPPAAPGVLTALHSADAIFVGPGSLFTSVLPPLLVAGMAEALRETQARVCYLCNPITEDGVTDGMNAMAHVGVLEAALGAGVFDDVLVNIEPPSQSQLPRFVEPETTLLRERGYRVQRGLYWSYAMGLTESAEGLREGLRAVLGL